MNCWYYVVIFTHWLICLMHAIQTKPIIAVLRLPSNAQSSRLVLLIGELCDWTNTIKRLQMQCNWQSMICLFISLCVCISIFFFYLLLINYFDWFDDDDDVDTIFMVFPSIECCCFFNAMNLLLADRKWSNDVLYHF